MTLWDGQPIAPPPNRRRGDGDLKIVPSNREVIDNQLLTALDDKSKVAILASEEDLDVLITALKRYPVSLCTKETQVLALLNGLEQLRDAAFEKSDT